MLPLLGLDDRLPSFLSYPHEVSSTASSVSSLAEQTKYSMSKNFRPHKSEELLAPKPHGSPPWQESPANDEVSPEGVKRSSSARLPKNVRFPRHCDSPTGTTVSSHSPYATASLCGGRIEEEAARVVTEHTQDQISALPAVATSPPGTAGSIKSGLSSMRESIRETRRSSNAGLAGLGRSLGSFKRHNGLDPTSNRESLQEAKNGSHAPEMNEELQKEGRRPSTKGSLFSFSRGSPDEGSTLSKSVKSKLPRATLKGLFPRTSDKDNSGDASTSASRHEAFWSPSRQRKTDNTRTGRDRNPPTSQKPESSSEDYLTASEGKHSVSKMPNALQLPDIVSQPSLESEIRIDLLHHPAEKDATSASSSRVSEISDQARAPSSISVRDVSPTGSSRLRDQTLGLMARRRSRNRNIPTRITEKSEPKGSSRDERPLTLRNLEDPFHVETSRTALASAGLTEVSGNESRLATPNTAVTIPTPIESHQPTRVSKNDAPNDSAATTLYDTICSSLRPVVAESDSFVGPRTASLGSKFANFFARREIETNNSGEPLGPIHLPKKRDNGTKKWKHADKNYFPKWGYGMPQEQVIRIVTRDRELSLGL